jgi:hypothetical protein
MHTYNAKNGEPLVSISLGAATAQTAEDIPAALNEADGRMYADKVRRRRQRKDCS